jgi:hypothetical protein
MRTQAPSFRVRAKGRYVLTEDYPVAYCSEIYNYDLNIPALLSLNSKGYIVVKRGFQWDGPSGPALNTVNTLGASLVHDVLYRAMRRGLIRKRWKGKADKLYRRMLKGAGVGYFRRWYHWAAVALFGSPK